jgi:hypothetical protein
MTSQSSNGRLAFWLDMCIFISNTDPPSTWPEKLVHFECQHGEISTEISPMHKNCQIPESIRILVLFQIHVIRF